MGLRSKICCLVNEKHVIHNAAKGVPRNVVINDERMSMKNIDLHKRVLEAKSKKDVAIDGSFKRINNRRFAISTKEQTKTLMTCMDNKRLIHAHFGPPAIYDSRRIPDNHRLPSKIRLANANFLWSGKHEDCLECRAIFVCSSLLEPWFQPTYSVRGSPDPMETQRL